MNSAVHLQNIILADLPVAAHLYSPDSREGYQNTALEMMVFKKFLLS